MSVAIHACSSQDLSFISPHQRNDEIVDKAYHGSPTDQYNLGMNFLEGTNGFRKNSKRAVYWLTQAVNGGEVLALNQLGLCYLEGVGVMRDENLAFQFLQLGAEKGDIIAMSNAALLATNGVGTSVNYPLAAELLQEATKQGYGLAAYQLGNLYLEGKGVPQDGTRAFQCFTQAVAQGVHEANVGLAKCYTDGVGTNVDLHLAKKSWITASLNGDVVAQRVVGEKLLTGADGFAVDPEKARRYLERAALAGDAQAQYKFALCCAQGIGGPQDTLASNKWLEKAAEQNHNDAKLDLEKLEGSLRETGTSNGEDTIQTVESDVKGTGKQRRLSRGRSFLNKIFHRKSLSGEPID